MENTLDCRLWDNTILETQEEDFHNCIEFDFTDFLIIITIKQKKHGKLFMKQEQITISGKRKSCWDCILSVFVKLSGRENYVFFSLREDVKNILSGGRRIFFFVAGRCRPFSPI